MEKLPRPDFLPDGSDAPQQMSVPPNLWGIKFSQFKRLCAYIKASPEYKAFKAEHGFVNLYHLNDAAIIPWTAQSPSSVSLLFNPHGLEADYVVCHPWAEDIEELEAALDAIFVSANANKDPVIWLCWLALYQAKEADDANSACGPSIAEQLEVNPFETVINGHGGRSLKAMIAVHTTKEDKYTRLWCLKELQYALQKEVKILFAPSPQYTASMVQKFIHWRCLSGSDEEAIRLWRIAGGNGNSLAVDTRNASCSCEGDAARIRREIESSPGGYDALDQMVFIVRKQFTVSHVKSHMTAAQMREAGYTILDMKSAGYGEDFILEAGFKEFDRRRAGLEAHESFLARCLRSGIPPSVLRKKGASLQELKDEGCTCDIFHSDGITAKELHEATDFTCQDLALADFSLEDLRAVFSLQELNDAGRSWESLHAKGASAKELFDLGLKREALLQASVTIQELTADGIEFDGLRGAGFLLPEIHDAGMTWDDIRAKGVSAKDLFDAGLTREQLLQAKVTIQELLEEGIGCEGFRGAGFSFQELHQSTNFTCQDFACAGYPLDQLRTVYSLQDLNNAGLSWEDLHARGVTAKELLDVGLKREALLQAKVTIEELAEDGIECDGLRGAGFLIQDLHEAPCFTCKDLAHAGYTLDELRSVYSLQDLNNAGLSWEDLHSRGASAKELLDAGLRREALLQAKISIQDLVEDGVACDGFRGAGFPFQELHQATRFTSQDFVRAGYLLDELRTVYSMEELTLAWRDVVQRWWSAGNRKLLEACRGITKQGVDLLLKARRDAGLSGPTPLEVGPELLGQCTGALRVPGYGSRNPYPTLRLVASASPRCPVPCGASESCGDRESREWHLMTDVHQGGPTSVLTALCCVSSGDTLVSIHECTVLLGDDGGDSPRLWRHPVLGDSVSGLRCYLASTGELCFQVVPGRGKFAGAPNLWCAAHGEAESLHVCKAEFRSEAF